MTKIEFISSELFPEDEYTKEIVYLCLEGKYRIAYARKLTKTGAAFWSVATLSVTRGGRKEYFPGFLQDSNFLEKEIKTFLDMRVWEKRSVFAEAPQKQEQATSMDEVAFNNAVPF